MQTSPADTPGAVVLLSGGLDSTVALAETLARMPVLCALTFDYGQRAALQELAATRAITTHYRVPHRVIELPWLAELLPKAMRPGPLLQAQTLSEDELFAVDSVWVPNRNGLFLNIAACVAEALGAGIVVFGANAEEGEAFPDNTPAFRDHMNQALAYATRNHVRVDTPLGQLGKAEIIRRGQALQVPFRLIWSCYEGRDEQCGQCASCRRVKAAQQAVEAQSGLHAGVPFKGD